MQEGATTLDPDARRKLYEQAMIATMADRAYIPVVQLQTVWAAKAGSVVFAPRFDEDTLAFFIKAKN